MRRFFSCFWRKKGELYGKYEGDGRRRRHVAYALGMTGTADVVKMLDVNETKLVSERQDLMDAVSFMPHRTEYVIADYADLADCDILINTAGNIAAVAGGDRTAELASSAAQVESYMPKIMDGGFSGIIINITNPCDVITALIAEAAGLPKGRVFGTGNCLDTSRLVSILAQTTGLEHHAFTAYVMGEHGNWILFHNGIENPAMGIGGDHGYALRNH